ncbi:hypothetical protein ACLMJK_002486 [Lecanora helva]
MLIQCVYLRCPVQLWRSNLQLRNAGFVSLGRLVNHQDESKTQTQTQTQPESEAIATGQPAATEKYRMGRRKSFAQQHQEQCKSTAVDMVLENLFSSTRTQENVARVSRYSRTPKERHDDLMLGERSLDRRLLELHNQLKRGTARLEYIWTSCQQLLNQWSEVRKDNVSESGSSRGNEAAFRDILLAVSSKQRILVHGSWVTPATIVRMYQNHGLMKYWWDQLLWHQLGRIIQLDNPPGERDENGDLGVDSAPNGTISTILQDTLEVWSLFLEKFGNDSTAVSFEGTSPKHADVDAGINDSDSPYKANERLLKLLPKHPHNSQINSIISAAIITSDFSDAHGLSYSPLMGDFFRKIRRCGEVNIEAANTGLLKGGVHPELITRALKRWTRKAPSYRNQQPYDRESSGERKATNVLDWGQSSLIKRTTELDGAFKRQDSERAINLWENYLAFRKLRQVDDKDTNDVIFARFLHTFWVVRRSDIAIEVWNYMIESGRTPGQMHWNAMLNGCVRARDSESLREIWTNMSRSKVKPDIDTWTTYIFGLIKLRNVQEGLQALGSLGRMWKRSPGTNSLDDSSSKLSSTTLTPAIGPVNAALSALISADRPDLISTVISWAESQDLRLETFSFNILLRPLVRNGTPEQVQSHLAQMAEHGCPPDVATFTIILNGILSNKDSSFRALPSKTQESTITAIIKDMEDRGIPPNAQTYTTLLHGLLNGKSELSHVDDTGSNNVSAARTILAHMQKQNVYPSPHIYTILMMHYFACKPPDLPAITSLWATIRHSGQTTQLDSIFYDRMIEGYADIDEIEKALHFLRLVPLEGKVPGWQALYCVLAALDRAGEWDMCRELLRDVDDTARGLFRHGLGRRKGKMAFYELVDSLKEKGVIVAGEEPI